MNKSPILIFLDVDGVLNKLHQSEADMMLDEDTLIDTTHPAHPQLSYQCMDCFLSLLSSFNTIVQIVISSSWRLDDRLINYLTEALSNRFGIDFSLLVVGSTTKIVTANRMQT